MPPSTPPSRYTVDRLTLPAIAAPMTAVSGPDLVIAACRSGLIGSFPTHNAATTEELDRWLTRFAAELSIADAPVAANLIVHRSNPRLAADLECLMRHDVDLVITSVGAPDRVVGPLHGVGTRVFADVANLSHAQRALDAGVDGLILLAAGGGGQTGWANPFAFVRAVRARYDGPIVLAGGIGDGRSILSAELLGADLVYVGTPFVATHESLADDAYKAAVVAASLDDVRLSSRVGGIPASLLASWLESNATGDESPNSVGGDRRPRLEEFRQDRLLESRTAWSAGHGVTLVTEVRSVAQLVDALTDQYRAARRDLSMLVTQRSHA